MRNMLTDNFRHVVCLHIQQIKAQLELFYCLLQLEMRWMGVRLLVLTFKQKYQRSFKVSRSAVGWSTLPFEAIWKTPFTLHIAIWCSLYIETLISAFLTRRVELLHSLSTRVNTHRLLKRLRWQGLHHTHCNLLHQYSFSTPLALEN